MTERTARPAADNNVADVINTLDEYSCGPIRALSQDPVQNAIDARQDGHTVTVEYRAITREDAEGNPVPILTITDSGTTGLDGPTLSADDLAAREVEEGGLVIRQDENWAAWEAMRYTKAGEDKLGSRGQGKYAYLYQSRHFPPGVPPDSPEHLSRMIILYDTLLPASEYRLGVRYHNPATRVVDPPFEGDEARDIVSGTYEDDHFTVPLGLEPLTEPGTRVTIPFLHPEADEAIRSGALVHWLEAEWWRQIQKGELTVRLITEGGLEQTVGVPAMWDGTPWRDDDRYFVRENVPLPSDRPDRRRIIKRIVLFHTDPPSFEDQPGPAQWNGVQLLRGGQWITTLETTEYSDWIPRDLRAGFCGFVEFDVKLERELRTIEAPAHDGFNKRTTVYREIVQTVRDRVKEFALERGWVEDEGPVPEPRVDEIVREFADLFVDTSPGPATPGDVAWSCTVEARYPDTRARVDWDDEVTLRAICTREPAADGDLVEFRAHLIRPDGTRRRILDDRSQALRSREGAECSRAAAELGTFEVGHPGAQHDPLFPDPGRYAVEVTCRVDGTEVARGRCSFYVAAEPPTSPQRLTLQLDVGNADTGVTRIDYGEELACSVTIRNYRDEPAGGDLAVTIEGEPYVLIRQPVSLPAAVIGDRAQQHQVASEPRAIIKDGMPDIADALVLEPGEHTVLASLESEGALVATATAVIVVGPEVEDEGGELPFLLQEVATPTAPRWRLEDPSGPERPHVLAYSTTDPVYRAIVDFRRPMRGSDRRPVEDYLSEVIAEGLVEWAARDLRARNDEGRLRLVARGIQAISGELVDRIDDRIEQLVGAIEDPRVYGDLQRELAALMVEAARQTRSS